MSSELETLTRLQRKFPNKHIEKNCTTLTTDKECYICDDTDQQPCRFEAFPPGFRITNLSQKEIYLLAIDHCLLDSDGPKRCDCIVFDDTYFCFMEMKLDVEKYKQAAERAKEAREQLKQTILDLKQALGDDYIAEKYRLEAYVVMQSQIYPRNPARLSEISSKFLQETKGIKYFEADTKAF